MLLYDTCGNVDETGIQPRAVRNARNVRKMLNIKPAIHVDGV